ncbi:MAG: HlyD family type I secretion periplasmic adaptor subunit [Pseudomonadota bacterium]
MTQTYNAKKWLWAGYSCFVVLFLGFGIWAANYALSGAVIVSAHFDTGAQRQIVQHPHGGVVATAAVEDGAPVAQGDILLTLDQPDWRNEHQVVVGNLIALQARRARLWAEHSGTDLAFDPDLLAFADTHPLGVESLENEGVLFDAQAALHRQTLAQIETQEQQLAAQAVGLHSEENAVARLVRLVSVDLENQQDLLDKGLTQASRVSSLDQQLARHARDMAQLQTRIAQLGGQGTRLHLDRLQLESDRRQRAASELRDVDVQLASLQQSLAALNKRLESLTVVAPIAGRIHGLGGTTVGTIVGPGAAILEILPQDGSLRAIALARPQEIDLIHTGQSVRLLLSDFGSQDAPEIIGTVGYVAADAVQNPNTGLREFRVEIDITPATLADIPADQTVQPGMSADAFFLTQDRTLLAMLVGPMMAYFKKAFRDT